VDDKNIIMNIKEVKNKFHSELNSIYPQKEIESFFYLLIQYRLNLKRVDIALNPTLQISTIDQIYFSDSIKKLKQEIPIQYIMGKTEFYGLPFYVDKNVLIPRPETEELVDWILKNTKDDREKNKEKSLNLLDIGTGSGCIAISLAKKLQNITIWALDVSKKALEIAQKNALLNSVEIRFLEEDILKVEKFPVKFDIIISNPPYVRELEKLKIKNNVLKYEPHLALFVKNNNPLLFYDKIADIAKENLNNGGQIYFEINQYLGKETVELLQEKGFQHIELQKDIFGNDRKLRATI